MIILIVSQILGLDVLVIILKKWAMTRYFIINSLFNCNTYSRSYLKNQIHNYSLCTSEVDLTVLAHISILSNHTAYPV